MSIKKLSLDFLNYCKYKVGWKPGPDDKPVENLLEALRKDKDYSRLFHPDTAYYALTFFVEQPEIQSIPSFTDDDVTKLLEYIRKHLAVNADKHWIVVPLRRAALKSTVLMRDFVFIAGKRDDKIETIRKICNISIEHAMSRALHTEESRSEGFFDHPLLAIKVIHQTDSVRFLAQRYALWAVAIIKAMHWGLSVQGNRRHFRGQAVRECEHLAICAKDDWRCSHQGLQFNADCPFDINWISESRLSKRFRDIFNPIVRQSNRDMLTFRFYRALRFFAKAIDTEDDHEVFEGVGISLLYLMIAAEGVLLDREYEKRIRLSILLPRLARLRDVKLSECMSALDLAYHWRSDFVHSGDDVYLGWNDDFSENLQAATVRLVKRMVAKLLTEFPRHYQSAYCLNTGQADSIEKKWFDLLDLTWKEAIGQV